MASAGGSSGWTSSRCPRGETVRLPYRSTIRFDRRGVFGPFEDLASLLVVIVAIALLVASIALALSNVRSDADRAEFLRRANGFLNTLRAYGNLTHEGSEGLFDGAKVRSLNWTRLGSDFAPVHLGFSYNVSIVDVSSYPSRNEYSRNDFTPFPPPPAGERTALYSSVAIWAGPNEVHEAQLILICWRA